MSENLLHRPDRYQQYLFATEGGMLYCFTIDRDEEHMFYVDLHIGDGQNMRPQRALVVNWSTDGRTLYLSCGDWFLAFRLYSAFRPAESAPFMDRFAYQLGAKSFLQNRMRRCKAKQRQTLHRLDPDKFDIVETASGRVTVAPR